MSASPVDDSKRMTPATIVPFRRKGARDYRARIAPDAYRNAMDRVYGASDGVKRSEARPLALPKVAG